MSDINPELIAKAAKAIDWKHHEYRVDSKTWIPRCVCGWTATEPYDVEGFDRHITETVLLAVVPDITRKAQAEALREAATAYQWGGWARNPQARGDLEVKRQQAEHAVKWLRDRARALEVGND